MIAVHEASQKRMSYSDISLAVLLRNAKASIPNPKNTVWVVAHGRSGEFEVGASFSRYEYAILLSAYLSSEFEPREVLMGESDSEIDRYVQFLDEGNMPYNVDLMSDGSVFEAYNAVFMFDPELLIQEIIDPETLLSTLKPIGISGTYWATHRYDAIDLADQYRLEQIDKGNLYKNAN